MKDTTCTFGTYLVTVNKENVTVTYLINLNFHHKVHPSPIYTLLWLIYFYKTSPFLDFRLIDWHSSQSIICRFVWGLIFRLIQVHRISGGLIVTLNINRFPGNNLH